MDLGRIVKWLVILGVVFVAWKVAVPWLKKQGLPSAGGTATAVDTPCVRAAAQASESWGSGLARFANPNPDASAWQAFRGMVEGRIGAAESACGCETSSCVKATEAMRDLRAVVSDMDNALRSNSPPPGDVVQRQEAIDNQINEARSLATQ